MISASHYSIQQEFVITELRTFIDHMIKTDPMEGRRERRRKRYKKNYHAGGKTTIDRMLTKKPVEKFDL